MTPPEGCLLLSVFGGVPIKVWGKIPPRGAQKITVPSEFRSEVNHKESRVTELLVVKVS